MEIEQMCAILAKNERTNKQTHSVWDNKQPG